MPNRQLTKAELEALFTPLALEVRASLQRLAGDDKELLWALRRKLAKELVYDERSKPNDRRKLKAQKRSEQGGLCAVCTQALPDKYVTLDRYEAMGGYTPANTRLICETCDRKIQHERGYR